MWDLFTLQKLNEDATTLTATRGIELTEALVKYGITNRDVAKIRTRAGQEVCQQFVRALKSMS